MNLLAVGVSYRSAGVDLRERLAFTDAERDRAAADLASRFGCEAAVLSTCNRVEIYLANSEALPPAGDLAVVLADRHALDPSLIHPHLQSRTDGAGVRHLFRVAASLDSLIVGEGQIAGQVRSAFEAARAGGSTGPLLNSLYQHAQKAAKRVRTETGISQGHVSVSSVAVDYVRQVFSHFDDKTVLVIDAGKMGRLTLKHLAGLEPRRILIANRSPEKAAETAALCGGEAVAWERLDEALVAADIVLATTGSPEPVVTRKQYAAVRHRRGGRPAVILDIAVPRDFDPAIHDGETTFLFNIDDLKGVRERTLSKRRGHVERAEAIVEEEARRFADDWSRRQHGDLIARLSREFEAKRQEVLSSLMSRLNGKLTPAEREAIEAAFRLFQNRLLHDPIAALAAASRDGDAAELSQAARRLFRLD